MVLVVSLQGFKVPMAKIDLPSQRIIDILNPGQQKLQSAHECVEWPESIVICICEVTFDRIANKHLGLFAENGQEIQD